MQLTTKEKIMMATCMDMVAMMMVMKVIIVIRRRTSTMMIIIKMKMRHI